MVPTLAGRIQTRLFLLLIVWACPGRRSFRWSDPTSARTPQPASTSVTFWVLAEVIIVGSLFWEPLYHCSCSSGGRRTGRSSFSSWRGFPRQSLPTSS